MLRLKGILMIIVGSMLWGTTGPIFEWIIANSDLTVSFLVSIRLTVAGILVLGFLFSRKKDVFAVWKMPSWRNQLIIFSIFGMLGLQFTFASAIEASNAVVATLLQFSAPIIVALYISIKLRKVPETYQIIGIVGTLVGLYLLLTNGSLDSLLVSSEALLWGIGVGVTFAFYTLYPARLMSEWSVLIVVGWAMLVGGVVFGIINQIWKSAEWLLLFQGDTLWMIIILIVFGTVAFLLFLTSMNYITPVETSILSSVEPLTAMVVSMLWFKTMLENIQLIGAILMALFITWLSIGGRNRSKDIK